LKKVRAWSDQRKRGETHLDEDRYRERQRQTNRQDGRKIETES